MIITYVDLSYKRFKSTLVKRKLNSPEGHRTGGLDSRGQRVSISLEP